MGVDRVTQYGLPLFIPMAHGVGESRTLERVALTQGSGEDSFSEHWLQRMILEFPQCLPVAELESGFGRLIPVGLELPTPAGYVDNLYVTPEGNLLIVECKLWRNPEARREVVAQIIDYAQSMARWSYQQLQEAVRKATGVDGRPLARDLFTFVQDDEALEEAAFVDAVSRNLRLGRLLLLIVGDGIREGAESLVDYLQMHAGFHFTLGIVETALYRMPDGGMIVQPRLLARTVNIERGIVRLISDSVMVEAMPTSATSSSTSRYTSISEEQFFEELSAHNPELVPALRSFLDRAADLGVIAEAARRSLNLRWQGPSGKAFGLGAITTIGELTTYNVNAVADSIGRIDLSHAYLTELAGLVRGYVKQTPTAINWYVKSGAKLPQAIDIVSEPMAWLDLIRGYTQKLRAAQQLGD